MISLGCCTACRLSAIDGPATRGPGQLVDEPVRALAGEQRERVDARLDAVLDGQRAERRRVVGLGETEADLAGAAVRGPIDLAGSPTTEVADDQLQGPADREVGPVALTQRVTARVHADGPGAGAAAHDDRTDRHRRGQQAVHVELVVARRFDRREDPGQVLGFAAGHHRGDRDLLDGDLDEIGWDGRDDVGGARLVPVSIAITRSSVGGTTGSPSVQPRVNIISISSSASATSMRRDESVDPPKRTRSPSTRSGSTDIEPHPGRIGGRSGTEILDAGEFRSHAGRIQPAVRFDLDPVRRLG